MTLLLCPFCGATRTRGGPRVERNPARRAFAAGQGFRVACMTCRSRGPERATQEEAVTDWNAALRRWEARP